MRTDVWLCVVAFAFAGCKPATRCKPLPDKSVVACIDDEPISNVEVKGRIRPAEWVTGSSTKPDPARLALDEAVRAQLLAVEAKRRQLKLPAGAPSANASWMLALREDESRLRNISRVSVTDEDAAAFTTEHWYVRRHKRWWAVRSRASDEPHAFRGTARANYDRVDNPHR